MRTVTKTLLFWKKTIHKAVIHSHWIHNGFQCLNCIFWNTRTKIYIDTYGTKLMRACKCNTLQYHTLEDGYCGLFRSRNKQIEKRYEERDMVRQIQP